MNTPGVALPPTFVEPDGAMECLTLSFSPSLLPLRQRWRNNGLSADFLADYVTTFFPGREDDPSSVSRQGELKAAVNYVANELLENAMKYAAQEAGHPITIRLILEPDRLLFVASNAATPERAERLKAFIDELDATDPQEMFVRILERGGDGDGGSGLGIVTMINDYAARVHLTVEPNGDGTEAVVTSVVVPITATPYA